MVTTVKSLLAEAEAEISRVKPQDAVALLDDPKAILVDVRDIRELQREGKIPGALHAPRGMLEFWIDPASPYHKDVFASGKRFVFYCSKGWRSALAAQVAQKMGLSAADIEGGFSAWVAADGPVEEVSKR